MDIQIIPEAQPGYKAGLGQKTVGDINKSNIHTAVDTSDHTATRQKLQGIPLPLLPGVADASDFGNTIGLIDGMNFNRFVLQSPKGFKNVPYWLKYADPEVRKYLGNFYYKYQPYFRLIADNIKNKDVKQTINDAEAVVKSESTLPKAEIQNSDQTTRQVSQAVDLARTANWLQQQLAAGKMPIKELANRYAQIVAKGKIRPEIYYSMKEYLPKLALALALGGKYDLSRSTMYDYGDMSNNDLIKGWAKNNWTYYGIPIAATALLGGGLIWGLSSLFSSGKKKKKRRRRPGYYGAEPEGYKPNGYYDIA